MGGWFRDDVEPVENYAILVESTAEASDDSIETDLSEHIRGILQANGIERFVEGT